MKTILITGGAGFIGSNFIHFMLKKYPHYRIVNYDVLTYAGNLENLKDAAGCSNYIFVKGDIRDRPKVLQAFQKYQFDCVIHFAAESHVDRSITEPEAFITTNIMGTQILLDTARECWNLDPKNKHSREYKPGVKFIHISTDEVYGALGETGLFHEDSKISPNSPYSASKASSDMFVRAYHETFGLPANITRCSNNYGPYQFPEKLIPLMINNCFKNKPMPVYGDGLQIRDWLHVSDHCEAIDCVLHHGNDGEVYNIGGNNEKTNMQIVRLIIKKLGKSESLISHVQDRPGHDRRYAIDSHKITSELGWRPKYTFDGGMNDTIHWYLDNMDWVEHILDGEYKAYYQRMYS